MNRNTDIKVTKALLGKLLARENVTIVHSRSAHTAMFNVVTRVLTLPNWKDMDSDLYDLCIGHEASHAIFTEQNSWVLAQKRREGDNLWRHSLMIVEDARIERLIKGRYPGLSKPMRRAYVDLYKRDFFGIKNLPDLNELNLGDRLNLFFKVGHVIDTPLAEGFEKDICAEIGAAVTFEEVVDIAERVYSYMKQNEQNKINTPKQLQQRIKVIMQDSSEDDSDGGEDVEVPANGTEAGDEDDDQDDSDEDNGGKSGSKSPDTNDTDEESDGDSGSESDDEDSDANDENAGEDSGEGSDDDSSENDKNTLPDDEKKDATGEDGVDSGVSDRGGDEMSSVTSENFENRMNEELIDTTDDVGVYELPEANLKNIIVDNKTVNDQFRDGATIPTYYGAAQPRDIEAAEAVKVFNTKNRAYIANLVSEFEIRKNATQYARSLTSKTGELDMNSIYKYRLSNDIFKRVTQVPKGKSHGMIFFMDMSGSMADKIRETVEQTLVLVSFCRQTKIPYDVYGFSDVTLSSVVKPRWTNAEGGAKLHGNFYLRHLIGSSLPAKDQKTSFENLAIVALKYLENTDQFSHRGWKLGSTPFIETLLASRGIIKDFNNKHQVDITNVIYLTDGDGSSYFDMEYPQPKTQYFVDKATRLNVKVEIDGVNNGSYYSRLQAAITELVRATTGCKHIGMFVGSVADMDIANDSKCGKSTKMSTDIRENGFFKHSAIGYDHYFFVVVKQPYSPVVRVLNQKTFEDSMKNRKKMRVIATEFSKEVATNT